MKNHALLVFAAAGMMLFTLGASAQEASTSPAEEPNPEEASQAPDEATEDTDDSENTAPESKKAKQPPEEGKQTDEPTPPPTGPVTPPVTPVVPPKTETQPKVETAKEPGDEKEKADDKKDDEEEASKRPYADSEIFWDNQFSAISLDRNHDYTYNPVYSMAFGLEPKWEIIKGLKLGTKLGFDTELTNSDFANKQGEVFINDIPFTADYKHSFDINDDVKFSPGAGMGLVIPASKLSRYATMYTALTLKISMGFMFPKVLKGLLVGWTPQFKKYFHESQSPKPDINKLAESGISPEEQMTSDTFQALEFAGGINPSWSINNGILIALSITESLSFSFMYTHSYVYKYAPTDLESTNSETDPMGRDPVRDTGYNERGIYRSLFAYEFSYDLPEPVNMFTPYLGALTMSNQLNEDGSYHTPFFNRETLITFGLRLNIDKTITAFQGKNGS